MVSAPDPYATLHGVATETLHDSSCFWRNERGDAHEAVVQQTLAGEAFFENRDGRKVVPAGSAMLFTHDESSCYGYPPGATEPYRQRYLSFRLGGLRPWFERLRAEFGPVILMPLRGEASSLFAEIDRRFRTRTFRDRFQETELLHQLLVALHREQIRATQSDDPIEYGRHYLQDNFRSPLNLKQVADSCGVSREHFIRTFRSRFGEPPGSLLRRLRLEHATHMLRATQLPLQEVALACGFADANTFCRAYRLHYGVTPGTTRAAATG